MIRHFFLDKTATIVKGSLVNTGNNPVMSLCCGSAISRGLIHFNLDDITNWLDENGLEVNDNLSIHLKMTNCSSILDSSFFNDVISSPANVAVRASSFDLVAFALDKPFDAGCGFDYKQSYDEHAAYSESGANWKYCSGNTAWNVAGAGTDDVLTVIHFDNGTENLDIDIKQYVEDCIDGEIDNNGIGLRFSVTLEDVSDVKAKYVGFFTDKTNTFFHPYIEVKYDDPIRDNRGNFSNNSVNKLYLYCFDDGKPVNLDTTPICRIDDIEASVSQVQTGVYCATVDTDDFDFENGKMYYDVWSNLSADGYDVDDVEMEFVVNPQTSRFNIGDKSDFKKSLQPVICGINDDEEISRGEIRELTVDFRKEYTSDKRELVDRARWRLYTKDGKREIDVFEMNDMEMSYLNNYFLLYTEDLIPGRYFVDVEASAGREKKVFKNVLHFKVVDNVSERFK